ncbi:MAG TPA: TetR/AcrR family transcriptional regulator [Acidobacteriaceae bacterium]|nr:TetR/AcrR family transcriptional regulator [Acidobacteriaceae bacterium]
MKNKSQAKAASQSARGKLLDAALHAIREKGYAGTSVDELCAAAGVTKGAFFHHFSSKEQLAVMAADYFSNRAAVMFSEEPHRLLPDPVDRLLAYIDQRGEWMQGELPEYTCLLGTMVQETYETHPAIREACRKAIFDHAGWLEADIREAILGLNTQPEWTAESLAAHITSVVQGAFILAKAQYSWHVAIESLDHLRRYVAMLFARPIKTPTGTRRAKRNVMA